MRSEQEIRRKLEISYCDFKDKKGKIIFDVEKKVDFSKLSKQLCFDFGMIKGCYKICKWVIEGEPRYSVAELEKIIKWIQNNAKVFPIRFDEFIYFLKDQKKVQEILK